jgi:hypothetical protein
MRGRESACDRLVRLRRFRVTTLRHSVCRRVVGWSLRALECQELHSYGAVVAVAVRVAVRVLLAGMG